MKCTPSGNRSERTRSIVMSVYDHNLRAGEHPSLIAALDRTIRDSVTPVPTRMFLPVMPPTA